MLRLRYGAAANQWRRVRELTSFTDRIGLVGRARVREPNIGRCDPVGVLQLLWPDYYDGRSAVERVNSRWASGASVFGFKRPGHPRAGEGVAARHNGAHDVDGLRRVPSVSGWGLSYNQLRRRPVATNCSANHTGAPIAETRSEPYSPTDQCPLSPAVAHSRGHPCLYRMRSASRIAHGPNPRERNFLRVAPDAPFGISW